MSEPTKQEDHAKPSAMTADRVARLVTELGASAARFGTEVGSSAVRYGSELSTNAAQAGRGFGKAALSRSARALEKIGQTTSGRLGELAAKLDGLAAKTDRKAEDSETTAS
jgi:hypothetical protein